MNYTVKFSIILSCLLVAFIAKAQKEENIILETSDCNIEGTLLIPDNDASVPLAIIIAGSGPTDRDGNNPMMTNNSLKMLAEGLAEHGIASLRYDKRGIGKSINNSVSEEDLRFENYINDVDAWINKLSLDNKFNKIILIGHSEGALIGSVAAQNQHVYKFISIAGTAKSIDKTIKEQLQAQPPVVLEQAIPIIDSLAQGYLVNNVPPYLNSLFRASVQPYLISWMKYDPCNEISKLDIPVLIIHGTTDIQVKTEEAKMLAESNKNSELILIEGMNHILKDSDIERNANIATYSNPTLPLNGDLIDDISKFILK